MKNKRIILIISAVILILVLVAVLVIVNVTKKDKADINNNGQTGENTVIDNSGNKVNTSNKLKQEREDQGFNIKNIKLKREGMKTLFTADITNISDSLIKGKLYNIIFLDKNNKEVSDMGLILRDVDAGETIQIKATIDTDVTECYNFKLQPK